MARIYQMAYYEQLLKLSSKAKASTSFSSTRHHSRAVGRIRSCHHSDSDSFRHHRNYHSLVCEVHRKLSDRELLADCFAGLFKRYSTGGKKGG